MRIAPLFLVLAPTVAFAQSRTDWQMHDGFEEANGYARGVVTPLSACPAPSPRHGAICTYEDATVPGAEDAGWFGAPNPDTIGFARGSRLCGIAACRQGADFTYFQTFVDVPANVVVNTFTIAFSGMDDGSRVSIYNSANPDGLVIPGSYVYLGGSGTADLGAFVLSGEVNRVVVTQVDDCCSQNNLRSAQVVLNGEVVVTNEPPVALCQNVEIAADGACQGSASVDAGSYDPEGGALSLSQSPAGPYGLGATAVTLIACDDEQACASCDATVSVVDETAPTVACNAAASIVPADAPIAFTATTADNCGATVQVGAVDCWAINGAGKRIDKNGSCVVDADGATVTVSDAGGVGTHIDWIAVATDAAGNSTAIDCTTTVAHPGNGSGCNQGLGNGAEGCDPGNSNNRNPSNDEQGGTPGNGGRKGR